MTLRLSLIKRALLVLSPFMIAGFLLADNWPRFRGPNGVGIVDNQNIPVKWEKDNILWKVPLPGGGHSSPVVWGNRLFVQTATPDAASRVLLCIDVNAGKTLWAQDVRGTDVKKHQKNSFASSTPAVDGERVYVSFWDGKEILLRAYDLEGKPAWSRNLGAFTSQHGAGASPIVFEDKVIFVNHQDFKSVMYGLDAKTGKTIWQTPREAFRACYASPFVWEREAGKKELVVVSTLSFSGYNPHTGKENWTWKWKHFTERPLRVTGSPAFSGNMIFACSGDGGGDRYMVAVNVNGKGKQVNPKLAWGNKKDFPYVPTVLAYKGHLYFVNDYGIAGCFEAKTGKQQWFERISEVAFTASPVIVDGNIYAADEEGDVYVLKADPAFQFLTRNSLGERVRATPAVANGKMYVRGRNHLFCIGN